MPNKNGLNATVGMTRMLAPGAELIVDGGVRHKTRTRREFYHGDFANPASSTPLRRRRHRLDDRVVDAAIQARRDSSAGCAGNRPAASTTTGRDYNSDRPQFLGAAPIHRYDLTQSTMAGYWQQTVTVLPSTDMSRRRPRSARRASRRAMLRPERARRHPLVCFPPFGCFGDQAGMPLDKSEINQA